MDKKQADIVAYQFEDETQQQIDVRVEDETVWLTQAQMAELFDSSKQNISLHINNVFKERELDKKATVKESLTVQKEGNRRVNRKIKLYNLDVIISVGYRVKSKRGTQFRIWANGILKEYLLRGYALNHRVDRLEKQVIHHGMQIEQLIQTALPVKEGIFYDGQVFDAYHFVCDLIKSAKQSILLIDNYVDDTVLTLLSKRKKGVKAQIYTRKITKPFQLDLKKHNTQYEKIEVKRFSKTHDRFLIIDESIVYHIGASLKDLGKKWFAFSKMKIDAENIIERINIK